MTLYRLGDDSPTLPKADAYWIAPGAHVMGRVILERDVGIWFGAVLRGDNEPITVGAGTNLQEHVMIHTDIGFPVEIGENCTIGHRATLHGCIVGSNSLVGMGATILNGAKIGKNCLIGAGALVTEGKEIPDGSLVVGAPGKVVRQLDEATIAGLTKSAKDYVANWKRYRDTLSQID